MRKKTTRRRASKKKSLGKFKSALEKYCSDKLREEKIPFTYEQHEYTLVEGFRFPHTYLKMTAKRKTLMDRSNSWQHPIRYTPDFVGKDERWIIETKGYLPSHHDFPMRWKLFLRFLVENDKDCSVYIARNRSQVDEAIENIKSQGRE